MSFIIEEGTIIRIKSGVWYKGTDLSGKLGMVTAIKGYIYANVSDFGEEVKLLRYEIEDPELDLFTSISIPPDDIDILI